MAWKHGYYYQNRRVGRKVISQYVGGGIAGLAAERLSERAKAEAEAKRSEWQAIKDEQQQLDKIVDDFSNLATAYADALLLINGYRQHKRSEWRKRRG